MPYLTKSKFKLAAECPTKLYYNEHPEYANQKSGDEFLMALAEGGYQVAELAKCYYREQNPVDLKYLPNEAALRKTNELLSKDNIVIFEAAIKYKNLFVRVDILVKQNNSIRLIEVKSKSIDPKQKNVIMGKRGGLTADWKPYLYDIAFQKHVLLKALPENTITAYLMLIDKSSSCPTDGLNQKFRIKKDKNGRVEIIVSDDISDEDLSEKIMTQVNVDYEIDHVFGKERFYNGNGFYELVDLISDAHIKNERIKPQLGKWCKECEFYISKYEGRASQKSGFKDCWSEMAGFKESDFDEPTILDVWDLRKKDELISHGIYKMSQIDEENIDPNPDNRPGLSRTERQWLQIEKVKNNDNNYEIRMDELSDEMNQWTYPFHFIDFETTRVPIPFNKGHGPNRGIAFQFSHHILYENGTVEHAGEYINTRVGHHPNIDFIRELVKQLNNDSGTIFRYSNHENTFLNEIYNELKNSNQDIADKTELLEFIKSISKSKNDSVEKWHGDRCMVDLWELVKRYYYDPLTNGSNSIKHVFPAILHRSEFLQKKYGKPIYGAKDGIVSLNFQNMQWLQFNGNDILDPYTLLPPIFPESNLTEEDLERLLDAEHLKNGSGAMIAYARMQFSEMSDTERKAITEALKKYCELDTLAMVMIVEAFQHL